MPSTHFSDDLKYAVRETIAGARRGAAAVQAGLSPLAARLRGMGRGSRLRLGLAAFAVLVFAAGVAMRGRAQEPKHAVMKATGLHLTRHRPKETEMTATAQRSFAVGKAQQSQGSYREAAESYATAARQGDARGMQRLVAMTSAPKCQARAEAADVLATFRGNKRAVAALKKLEQTQFDDEPRNPGIFACDSHRAARKALDRLGNG
ncbi:MAG TPA: hypothetical protein VI356_10415 [Myxococcales bacterium]